MLARPTLRLRRSASIIDGLVAAALLGLMAVMTLLTPAFTDYEVEIEPFLAALVHGHPLQALELAPLYGGSLLIEAPFAAAGLFVGGSTGMFRAAALPGALLLGGLGMLGAGWAREARRPRREQLGILALLVASPSVAQAWSTGHAEEVLVAAAAIAGLLLIERAEHRGRAAWPGAIVLGLACGGKLWPLALVPLALALSSSWRRAVTVAATAVATSAALIAPQLLSHASTFVAGSGAVGGAGITTPGNVWWFLGARNPNWVDPTGEVVRYHAAGTSYRTLPEWVTGISHPLIFVVAGVIAAGWWWQRRRLSDHAPAEDRVASLLEAAAAIIWWRALLDGWYQPYYLVGALAALTLAGARRGRLPWAAAVSWAALWLINGPSNIATGWSPDAISAATLAWAVPVGLWTTARALRSPG